MTHRHERKRDRREGWGMPWQGGGGYKEWERQRKRGKERGKKGERVKRFQEQGGRKKNNTERWERVMSLPLYQRIKPVGWWNSDEGNGTADIYIRGYWWSRDNRRLHPLLLLFSFCLLSLVYHSSLARLLSSVSFLDKEPLLVTTSSSGEKGHNLGWLKTPANNASER